MKTYYLLIHILLLSAVCASCSKEEGGNTPEPELPATPKLSIELNSRDIATKADDDYTPTKELEGSTIITSMSSMPQPTKWKQPLAEQRNLLTKFRSMISK